MHKYFEIVLELENDKEIITDAPANWGESVDAIAEQLRRILNSEEDLYINVGDRVLRRELIWGATIREKNEIKVFSLTDNDK